MLALGVGVREDDGDGIHKKHSTSLRETKETPKWQ